MILSGTGALREYFDAGGVVFVENHEPETLAAAIAHDHFGRREIRERSSRRPGNPCGPKQTRVRCAERRDGGGRSWLIWQRKPRHRADCNPRRV